MCADSRFAKPRFSLRGRWDVTFCGVQKVTQKARARTCKKLPVASFCASETAETGRIANGCEQGDHVSRSRLRPATSVQNSMDYVFFVLLPFFVPKPACVATRFFGCFEPVRKGYCSEDARLMFFGKGLPHCKLTGESHI